MTRTTDNRTMADQEHYLSESVAALRREVKRLTVELQHERDVKQGLYKVIEKLQKEKS
jgi:hypothetical protein